MARMHESTGRGDASSGSPLRRTRAAHPRRRLGAALPARRLLAGLAVSLLIAVLAGAPAMARPGRHASAPVVAAVPPGFVGVDADGPLFGSNTPLNFAAQVKSMVANGVQSIRVAFNWAAAQPYENTDKVPVADQNKFTNVDGRPTDFSTTDEVVQAAARARVTVLPTILYAPSWDARRNPYGVDTPKRNAPYAAYAAALVSRYGRGGIFWSEHPGLPQVPITQWQIWNEPNISYYWPQPFANSYVSLLRLANSAIKGADPQAKVVLGALTNFAWKAIGQIYRLPNTRNLFDIVSINGFTKTPADEILYMRFMRNAMSRFQDGSKPLLATEISWTSAQGHTSQHLDFNTTPAGQARDIAQLLPMIGQVRTSFHLAGFYWYTWIANETPPQRYPFNYAGLLRLLHGKVVAKPALSAFRTAALALEQCQQKGSVATSCVRAAPVPKPGPKPAPKRAPKPAF